MRNHSTDITSPGDTRITLAVVVPLLRQQLRRLTFSMGHLLTTAIGSCVTLALFMYIFGDFLREKLPQTNSDAAESIRFYFVFVLILGAGVTIYKWCDNLLFNANGWTQYLQSLAIRRTAIRHGSNMTFCSIVIIANLFSTVLIKTFFGLLTTGHYLSVAAVVMVSMLISGKKIVKPDLAKTEDDRLHVTNQNFSLVTWRERRLKGHEWRGAGLRLLAWILIVIGPAAILTEKPVELTQLSSLFGGIILSWIVPIVIEEDLRFTWLERQAAISHRQWINAWQKIFTKWAVSCFLVSMTASMVVYLCAIYLRHAGQQTLQLDHMAVNALIAAAMAAFPVWLAPAFVLQIDGRQIATNIVMLTLIGIFIGPAVIALPILVPGIWLLGHEAHRYQEGRFARASYY